MRCRVGPKSHQTSITVDCRGLSLAFATCVVLLPCAASFALAPGDARIESVAKIWDAAPHNAFTDLTYFEGAFFATFREASAHAVPAAGQPGGVVRVIRSTDGLDWSSVATFSLGATNHDLRDPKLTVTPDDRLTLLAADTPAIGSGGTRQSYTWFSDDGTSWSTPGKALGDSRWLWRAEWNPADGNAYGISYESNSTRFHGSPSGGMFATIVPTLAAGNEAALTFLSDGTAATLVRREGAGAQLGISSNLTDWSFRDTGVFVGGPDMIQLPDGRIIVGGRFLDNFTSNPRTSLGLLNLQTGTIQEFLRLPSGGDTGYPGLVWQDDKLWVSYYASHENNKSHVYLASVSFDNYTDTFARSDAPTITNSLGKAEAGNYTWIERGNTAAQSIPTGTAQLVDGRLRLTGSNQGVPTNTNTGGAYLSGFDVPDARVSLDLGFELDSVAPSGIAGADSNKFNNTFLLMLRSRPEQNFGNSGALENGLVAIELGPNGDLLIREQTGAGSSGLSTIRSSFNYITGAAASRQPLPGQLPGVFGDGTFDTNQNGYIDGDESIHFGAELIGTSLRIYLNGEQYGPTFSLANASAAFDQLNGVGLHKNRLGSSGGFLNQVANNVLIDNFRVDPIYSNPGDFNRDGVVDAADYVIWRKGAGETFTAYHYDQWRANFSRTFGSAATEIAEPQTLLNFLMIMLLSTIGLRKRPPDSRHLVFGHQIWYLYTRTHTEFPQRSWIRKNPASSALRTHPCHTTTSFEPEHGPPKNCPLVSPSEK
jgi:hypothetical protein